MKITSLELVDVGDLADVYNEQVAWVPHCYPTTPEEFEAALHERTARDKHAKQLGSDKLFIGEENGAVIGFAHAAMGELDVDGYQKCGGFIHFLTYRPGRRAVGQALLEACERHLREARAGRLWAFQKLGGYPF